MIHRSSFLKYFLDAVANGAHNAAQSNNERTNGAHTMEQNVEAPVPNYMRFGFATGYIAIGNEGLVVSGEPSYPFPDEERVIDVTPENYQEMVRVLRYIAAI